MVFYRKYRSQTIDQLDSTSVRDTLNSILSAKDIPHAFLFTGPKGLGKTSTARILAKAINCTNKKAGSHEPCNTCDSCISITNGSNVDIIEIDGASNRGIDEIRDLREKVRFAPVSARTKVYIIDEVHMLTTEAFNALLKTVEEPPAHVLFIFCTTESHKIPETIVSRCFQITFRSATDEEIVRALRRIVEEEKISIDSQSLHLIAHLAEGGFRDAVKMLEEVVLLAGENTITIPLIEKKFNIQTNTDVRDVFLTLLKKRKTKELLLIIQKIIDDGGDIKYFITQLIQTVHTVLLQKAGINPEGEVKTIDLTIEELSLLVELLTKSYSEIKFALIPQLPLEIAVINWCMQGKNISLRTEEGKLTIAGMLHKQRTLQVKNILEPSMPEKVHQPAATHEQREIDSKNDEKKSFMENLIYKTQLINHSVAAVLRGCTIKAYSDDELVLETSYKFHKERLEEHKTQKIIEKAIKEITGNEVPFRVVLRNQK